MNVAREMPAYVKHRAVPGEKRVKWTEVCPRGSGMRT